MPEDPVTSIEHARDRYEKRQKTWQEKSYELEQSREKEPVQSRYGQTQAASLERLRQFETMLRQMIRVLGRGGRQGVRTADL